MNDTVTKSNSPSSDDTPTFFLRFLREVLASRSWMAGGPDKDWLTLRVDFLGERAAILIGEASLEKSEPTESSKSTRDVDGS